MVHVPVDYGRQLQPPEMGHFEAERPAREMHLARDLNEGPECDPLERYRMLAAKGIKIDAVPVIGADHGQTGQTAFRGMRQADDWEIVVDGKIEKGGHDHILTL